MYQHRIRRTTTKPRPQFFLPRSAVWVEMFFLRTALFIGILASYAFSQAASPSPSPVPFPEWKPPADRAKAKTPFAPKPTKGNNIFQNNAEGWLADAILKTEASYIKPIKDAELNAYITKLGNYLALYSAEPSRKYTFTILDESEENAFSIGDGRIYINLGLLVSVGSEDELAAVISHEIGHDAFKHGPKTVTRQLFWTTGVKKVTSAAEVEKSLSDLLAAYRKNEFATVAEQMLGWSRNDELQADKTGFI
jgi:predicted Zn-dependent protease